MNELRHLAKEHNGLRFLMILSAVMTGASVVGQAYFFVTIVDRIFLQNASFESVIPLLMGLLAVLAIRVLFTYINGRAGVRLAAKVKQRLREQLLEKYTRNPIQASMQGQSGQKVSVMMDAVDEVDSYFSKYIPQVIQTSVVPLMIAGAALYVDLIAGLIMIITAPFIPLFFILAGIKTQKKAEDQMEKLQAFSGRFLDTLQGLTTLKLFGRANEQKKSIRQSSLDFRDATMGVLKIAFVSGYFLEFISMLSIGLIALSVGLRIVIFESMTFAPGFFVLILAPEFYLYIKDLGSAFHTGRGSVGAAKTINEALQEEEKPVQWGQNVLPGDRIPSITLDNVTFSYGEGFSLGPVRTEIKTKSQVAIVGRSGSGKSTLLNVLAGLVPAESGRVLVNGESRDQLSEESWFDQISYISQHPYLFSGTIAENIAIGKRGEVSREEIMQAAEKAGISGLIESLENGYDTPVGEAGRGLSGGEKQRVALARAFLKKPSIILFDEPTTGLDLFTERILQRSIQELGEHSTIITVAHRLHTIQGADQLLFLEKGELVGAGTHAELVKTIPAYREMVSIQQGGVTI